MKIFPENKPYYFWVFLGLFGVVLIEFMLLPKFLRCHVYSELHRDMIAQLQAYEQKIQDAKPGQ